MLNVPISVFVIGVFANHNRVCAAGWGAAHRHQAAGQPGTEMPRLRQSPPLQGMGAAAVLRLSELAELDHDIAVEKSNVPGFVQWSTK